MNADGSHFVIDCDGRGVAAADLPIDALSLGRGVFETMLLVNGRIAFRNEHVSRLVASSAALELATADSVTSLFAAAESRVRSTPVARARMRLAVFSAQDARGPVALVAVSEAARPESLSLWLSPDRRSTTSPILCHKTVDYLGNLLARAEARRQGCGDALILDTDGNVAETTTANVFFFIDGAILTPRLGCILPGIVRAWVLSDAPSLGLPIAERDVPAALLSSVQAAFVTNSIIGLAPVSLIGDHALEDAGAEDWFIALRSAYERKVSETAPE